MAVIRCFSSSLTMAPILYMQHFSGPARSVLLTAAALGLKLQHKIVDLSKQEHLTESFLKLNPQHTIPTLEDDGVFIWDSHAINAYLVAKYGKDDSLYPKDLAKRAMVDQRMHFDSGLIFSWLRNIARGVKYKGCKSLTEDQIEGLEHGYEHLNTFLKNSKWVTGNSVTIADFSLIANVTTLNIIYPVDKSRYGNISRWLKDSEALPYYDVNREGLDHFKMMMKPLLTMAPRVFVTIVSPAVRATLLTTHALGINIELEEIDLNNKEQFKPSFIKINPQHTVPTLQDDDDFVVWDSHVINGYLVDKYGGIDDSLYPTDMQERAKVNQKLHFDTEFALLSSRIIKGILHGGKKSAPQEQVDEIIERYDFLEKFLTVNTFVALGQMTIADFSLVATVSTIDIIVPIDAKKYPKITAWIKKMQALPYYAANKNGLDKIRNQIAAALEG
ncbi:uncharacterized protein LOC123014839 [Tribolium madens]|uniref:uncharacterized protein LOC123014839 n=1 Tax=Tribolium madens TaxID=41895 RepID=UPI001CF72934|nr:uncharacterized protein LOC123014839 [Tribolium madens]